MKKIIMLWCLLCIQILSYSQTITITDKESKQPIEFATIYCKVNHSYAITNANGQANISELKGSENIEIRSLGYKTLTISYENIEKDSFKIALLVTNLNLEEVVVSATRWRQNSGKIPSKIISIMAKDASLQNPQTAADLLSISGKVYIQKSQQGGGSPMIRGFATNRLLYTVDGVRMNTAIFRSGNIQNVINIDPFATENTEVLFGPGSVIYGSDAIGGVMSFQTLTPQFSLNDKPLITGKAVTRFSSANKEKTGHFDVNLGWKKIALITSISTWNYDHLRQGENGPDDYLKPYYVQHQDSIDKVITQDDPLLQIPTGYSQINMMQKIHFAPNKKWDFQYGFHYSETSSYGRYDRHNRTKNGLPRYAEWDYGPQKWMMNCLNITQNSKSKLYDRMTIRLAQQSFEESRIDRTLYKVDRNTQTENVEAYSANIDFTKLLGKKNTLFYGVEYVYNDVISTGVLTDISNGHKEVGPARYPKSQWQSMAVYLNDVYEVTDKFTIQTGIRYNHFLLDATFDTTFYPFPFTTAAINEGALTGSIGGIWRPTDTWVLSTNLGTGFRSPNIDDMGKVFDSEPGTVTIPNPSLKAEYAYNMDIGIAKVLGDFVKIDATGYYTLLKNALVRRDFTLNNMDSILYDGEMSKVQAIQNAAKAYVFGIQAGLEVKLPKGFSFSSDINYQKGEEELDDGSTSTLRHAAPMFGTTRISYKAQKLNMQFYGVYQSERKFADLPLEEQSKDEIYAKDASGNNYSPAWYTLNFKAMYSFTKNLTASAGIENITDQRYRPYSSGISGAGRNVILSLKASF